jgi:hypothetical protein
MIDLYSVTLAASIITLLLALCGSVIAKFWVNPKTHSLQKKSRILAVISLVLVLFSLFYHIFTGHRPGSETALSFLHFTREHPAFWIILILAIFALFLNSAKKKSGK